MYSGELVILRLLDKTYIDSMTAQMREYNSLKSVGRVFPISRSIEENFVEHTLNQYKKGSGYYFAMVNKNTDELLGTCSLDNIDPKDRRGVLGILIFQAKNQNMGYGTDAMKLLLWFGFTALNLHRIELTVFDFNEIAIHVYEKVGFTKVGRKREAYFVDGVYNDVLVMDILEGEYYSNHPRGSKPPWE